MEKANEEKKVEKSIPVKEEPKVDEKKKLEEKVKKLEEQSSRDEENIFVLENKIETLNNDIKVLKAENINYRKRKDDEVAEKLKYANKDLILEILPALDNFKLSLKGEVKDEVKAYAKGFEMIYRSLENTLASKGVTKIDEVGVEFDGAIHECLLIEHDNTKKDNEVLEIIRDGYKLYDRVIRPAQVKVNKIEKEMKNE